MAVICDMETDGLYPEVSTIHCVVFYDTETEEYTEFTPKNIHTLKGYLEELSQTGKILSMHNGIGFDLKVWKKLLDYKYPGEYRDTLLMARILWPDISPVRGDTGRHSVAAWGIRFGIEKPSHQDWTTFSPEMLHRCKEDVKIQAVLYEKIENELKSYTERDARLCNWVKILNLEHKVWEVIEQQADHGWLFDVITAGDVADELQSIINKIDDQLNPLLPIRTTNRMPCKGVNKDGSPSHYARAWVGDHLAHNITGDFSRVVFEKLNLGSEKQLKDYLLELGWTPTAWNFKKDRFNKPERDRKGNLIRTSPRLPANAEEWDAVAKTMKNPLLSLLSERGKASHRLSQVKGLIDATRLDRRIEARANTCGTNTARMTHRTVVNIPKAKDSVYFGKKIRALFIVPEDKVLVGFDAHALEARCEAHYVYPFDKGAAHELLEGDIHQLNANVFQTSRDIAKNGKYAILYGCSPEKLATTIGKPITQAKQIYDNYWNANDGLQRLKSALERQWDQRKYLVAIDGRPLTIRYKHALLNTLLQSCGSIIMKVALCILKNNLDSKQIEYAFVGNFHDEFQIECNPEDAEGIGKLAEASLEAAGKYLRLNIPLRGEFKIAKNWRDTH